MNKINLTAAPVIEDLINLGLLEAIGDGISIQDTDFRIMYQNEAQRRLMGNQTGKYCYEVYEGKESACEGCPMAECFRDGKAHTAVRTAEVSGKTLYFEITSSPIKNSEDKIIAGIEVIRDISDRKRLEEQFLHSQKMKSIGTLAAGVAHDFNNILTAIIGFSTIIKRRIPETDPLQFYIKQIQSAAKNGTRLTMGLLSFGRMHKGQPVAADFNDLIRSHANRLQSLAGEDIDLNINLSSCGLFVKVDPDQMEQVLMNLTANARDAMPRGGRLTIQTDSISIDETFTRLNGFGTSGEYALISISDTGAGMDAKTKGRIFEPFFTTRQVNKGTGLGLSIVYGIIKEHSGYIDVLSEPGQGTTLSIYLPLISPSLINQARSPDNK